MRYFLTFLTISLNFYRAFSSSGFACCRFHPCCSIYAIQALKNYGFKGIGLIFKRLLRCHPWTPMKYDPVPEKGVK